MMAIRMLVMILVSLVAMASAHHPTMGGGSGHKGYSLGIRDSIMIAHSFEGPQFGPAQQVLVLLYETCVAICSVAICSMRIPRRQCSVRIKDAEEEACAHSSS